MMNYSSGQVGVRICLNTESKIIYGKSMMPSKFKGVPICAVSHDHYTNPQETLE